MSKQFKIVNGDISDGYHTFDELYEHRVVLYMALAKASNWPAFYKLDYEEWFCLFLETPKGQVSYHLPNKYLDNVKTFAVLSPDHIWDGHTSADVLERLK